MSIDRPSYRADLDGLRAVAILAVLVFHAFPGQLLGGFLGVDVFFVLSGYLISGLILDEVGNGTFSVAGFYGRRVRRIFPALIAVLAATYAFGWLALFADEFANLSAHLVAGAGFASNFLLQSEAGYFDRRIEVKPLAHLWSLSVEEQFYLVWPWLVWLGAKRRNGVALAIGGLFVASVTSSLWLFRTNPSAAFYLPLPRLWELMAGAGLAWAARQGYRTVAPWPNLLSVAALLALAAAMKQWLSVEPAVGSAVVTIGACALITTQHSWINRTLLANRAAVAIGLISYPLYLWHWPLLSFQRIVLSQKPSVAARMLVVAAAFALAWATMRLVERPIRFGGLRARAVRPLVGALAAMAIIGALTYRQDGLAGRFDAGRYGWTPEVARQLEGSDWRFSINSSCQQRYPFEGNETLAWWFCILSKDEPPTVLILGTSYANQLYPGLASDPAFAAQSILSIGTCDPRDVERPVDTIPKVEELCSGDRAWRQQQFIDALIARTPTIKFVILAGLDAAPTVDYRASLLRRAERLARSGAQVIAFEPHLRPDDDIRGCFGRPFRAETVCAVHEGALETLRAQFQPLVDDLSASNPAVPTFRTNDALCDAGGCHMSIDGVPLYRDEDAHLSEFASRRVASRFAEWARTHVPALVAESVTRDR